MIFYLEPRHSFGAPTVESCYGWALVSLSIFFWWTGIPYSCWNFIFCREEAETERGARVSAFLKETEWQGEATEEGSYC